MLGVMQERIQTMIRTYTCSVRVFGEKAVIERCRRSNLVEPGIGKGMFKKKTLSTSSYIFTRKTLTKYIQ